MQIDAALAGVIVTILLGLMALAYGYGSLNKEVGRIRKDTDKKDNEYKDITAQIRAEFKSYQIDNKGDHKQITDKLDRIILNGKKS